MDFLNGMEDAARLVGSYERPYLSVVAVGELLFGVLNSARQSENRARVDQFVSRSTVLSTSMTTAGIYAQLRLSLQRKGRPIPENDVWIAAVCMEHGLPLATRDAHFRHVEGLQVVRP